MRLAEEFLSRKRITTLAEVSGATVLIPTTFSRALVSLSVNLAGSCGVRKLGWALEPKLNVPGITRITSRLRVLNCEDTPEYNPSPTDSITTIAMTPMIMPREDMRVLNLSALKPTAMNSIMSGSFIWASCFKQIWIHSSPVCSTFSCACTNRHQLLTIPGHQRLPATSSHFAQNYLLEGYSW